jgi:hypothetical protein
MSTRLLSGSLGRRTLALASLLMGMLVGPSAAADAYGESWGPEIGSQLPVLEAFDQAGTARTLENLSGEHGLVLFMNRSADW